MPKVSVIIPAYNSARFLLEAIESVLVQPYKDYEIIVIDDGSTDNTKEILEPYFDRINYIYQQNQGVASARNTGIKHSRGEYIAFLDTDDVWLPEKLHMQVNHLDNNPEIAMVYSRFLWMNEDGKLAAKKSSPRRICLRHDRNRATPSGDVFNILFSHNFIPTSTVMVRKRILDTVGLFDESLKTSEDRDLWLRIAREFKVSGINKHLCKHRQTSGSLSGDKEIAYKFRRHVIEKHYKLSQDLGHPINSALYKKTLARLFYRAGKWHLAVGDRKKALENFLLSLKHMPFNPRTLKYCFITYIKQVLGSFVTALKNFKIQMRY